MRSEGVSKRVEEKRPNVKESEKWRVKSSEVQRNEVKWRDFSELKPSELD